MNSKSRALGWSLTSLLVLAAAVGGASAAAPVPLPEYGFKGLKRIEIVFVNAGRSGVAGGVVPPKDSAKAELPGDDLASRDLEKEPDCQAAGKSLLNAGLEIVEKCKPDDFACGQLYLSVANQSIDRVADRIYLAGAVLSQPVKLARDKKVELAMSSTWSAYRVVVVAADHSATSASCADLRSLATWFGSSWKLANK
jgi:hypothetical protein